VPEGVEVAANGDLVRTRGHYGWTTWSWRAPEPMASYLATIDIGDWDVTEWTTTAGLPVYDAVDSAITGGLRDVIDSSLARQGEILDVLGAGFGPYPFHTTGAIVDNHDQLRFALETQTRPVYSKFFWLDRQGNPRNADWVVVHELAHQWFGDDLAVAQWDDIWLNEGFASYAEWMWAEYEGQGTTQEIFQATYDSIPADDPFWSVPIGDPGVTDLFSDPVYVRGAMTLQALRNQVGDDTFWAIVQQWAADQSGGNVSTDEFVALAEQVSGQQLDDLFNAWLFTQGRPELSASPLSASAAAPSTAGDQAPAWGEDWHRQVKERLATGRY
jgi:aminopeptidase N